MVIKSSLYFVLLNYSYKHWSNVKTRDRFGICMSWQFQNCPWKLNLAKIWLRKSRYKTMDWFQNVTLVNNFAKKLCSMTMVEGDWAFWYLLISLSIFAQNVFGWFTCQQFSNILISLSWSLNLSRSRPELTQPEPYSNPISQLLLTRSLWNLKLRLIVTKETHPKHNH